MKVNKLSQLLEVRNSFKDWIKDIKSVSKTLGFQTIFNNKIFSLRDNYKKHHLFDEMVDNYGKYSDESYIYNYGKQFGMPDLEWFYSKNEFNKEGDLKKGSNLYFVYYITFKDSSLAVVFFDQEGNIEPEYTSEREGIAGVFVYDIVRNSQHNIEVKISDLDKLANKTTIQYPKTTKPKVDLE